ncbi:MAG: hypothetical protein C4292_04435, partial [Nitrososphaera sp.]
MTSNKTMRNYAIMGAIGVGALAVILLALGSMQAPQGQPYAEYARSRGSRPHGGGGPGQARAG